MDLDNRPLVRLIEVGRDFDVSRPWLNRVVEGAMPRLNAIPPGCAFNPRCPKRMDRCVNERPVQIAVGPNRAACWLYE